MIHAGWYEMSVAIDPAWEHVIVHAAPLLSS